MRTKKTTIYICKYCGREDSTKSFISKCEEKCKKNKDAAEKQAQEYQRQVAHRIEMARKIAIEDEAIVLLVTHGYIEDAKTLCKKKASYALWDCGTSSGWTEVYEEMIKAVEV